MIVGTVAIITLLLFFAYWTNVVISAEEHLQFDLTVIDWVQGFVSDALTPIVIVITEIGYIYVIIPIALIVLWVLLFKKKHYWETFMLAVCVIGGDLIKVTIKNIMQRERPNFLQLVEETSFSFPSGHTIVSITFYGMLAYILWLNLPDRKGLRTLAVIIAPVIIIAVGLSRIYLGVHYPSDVIASFAIGGAWLLTCILALNSIRYYKSGVWKKPSTLKK